jgi:hypothetical protein
MHVFGSYKNLRMWINTKPLDGKCRNAEMNLDADIYGEA